MRAYCYLIRGHVSLASGPKPSGDVFRSASFVYGGRKLHTFGGRNLRTHRRLMTTVITLGNEAITSELPMYSREMRVLLRHYLAEGMATRSWQGASNRSARKPHSPAHRHPSAQS